MAHKIAMAAIALILVVSAVSVVATADTSNGHNPMGLGDYSFSVNNATSTVNNLTYTNDHSNAMVANSIATSGNASNIPVMANGDSNHMSLKNVTLFTAGDGESILFSTVGTSVMSNPMMTFNLSGNVSKVMLGPYQRLYLLKHMNNGMSMLANHQIYKIQANNTTFYMFANSQSNLNGNVVTFQGGSTFHASSVIVGITPASTMNDVFGKDMGNRYTSPFTYNNTTGVLTGSFLSLNFNSSTGIISNFTDSAMGNMTIFNAIMASGNGTTANGTSGGNPGAMFPTMQPIVLRNLFYYANSTAQYQIHNNPVLMSNFFLENGTMTFNVSSGLNVTAFTPSRDHLDMTQNVTDSVQASGGNDSNNQQNQDQADVSSSNTMIFIQNSTFRGTLFVNGGNVTVNGNTVSIITNGSAQASFVAPLGIQKMKKEFEDGMQYAITHQRLAALLVLGSHGLGQNISMEYNSSMNVSVKNVSSDNIVFTVSSIMHHGNNLAVFVPNSVMSNTTKLSMKFDNQTINHANSLSSVVNSTSRTTASYYTFQVNGGTMVVIHIPHFSNHTLEIVNASANQSNGGLPGLPGNSVLYIALGLVGAIAVIAGITVSRRRRH